MSRRQVLPRAQPSLAPWAIGVQFLQAKIRATVVPEVHSVAQPICQIQSAQDYVRQVVSALKALHRNALLLVPRDIIV